MEQYWMPKRFDFKNLRLCLDSYHAERLFIRPIGASSGMGRIYEKLQGKSLDFTKNKSGLRMLIDSKEIFYFPLKVYEKGFSLAYERVEPVKNGVGKIIRLSHGADPYDPLLPEPARSILRTDLDDYLMEITFTGRIHLKFHSWWQKPHWKYWTVAKPEH